MECYTKRTDIKWSEIPFRVSCLMGVFPEERDFVFKRNDQKSDVYSLLMLAEGKPVPLIKKQVCLGWASDAKDVRRALDFIVPHAVEINHLPQCLRLNKSLYDTVCSGWGIYTSYNCRD